MAATTNSAWWGISRSTCSDPITLPRRSRLAGEEVRKPCSALGNAFAGKPTPTPGYGVASPGQAFPGT
ncbi:MAG: hypothetical protein DI621_30385 [Pseudomonas protegens]|nr:hypothetical protein C1883_30220 [Pseudomonas protegens]PZP02288.1 MAG: hypothetical protein DI621_30385 [Pseudomonas protegens]